MRTPWGQSLAGSCWQCRCPLVAGVKCCSRLGVGHSEEDEQG